MILYLARHLFEDAQTAGLQLKGEMSMHIGV